MYNKVSFQPLSKRGQQYTIVTQGGQQTVPHTVDTHNVKLGHPGANW